MKLFPLLAAIVLSTNESAVTGFSQSASSPRTTSSRTKLQANCHDDEPSNSKNHRMMQRRNLLTNLFTASSALLLLPAASNAEALSITSDEFDIILKDSAKSILSVELSGPKSETAIVKLVDGTTFTISDLVESSVDPRSPLKLVARCRLYKITVRNTGLVSAVTGEGNIISTSGKKKKNFMNPRVQEAEKKNVEKRARMAEDERERLEELYKMEGSEKEFLKE